MPSPPPSPYVAFAAIEAAAQRLRGVATRTPVLTSRRLDAREGAQVFVKAECFQRTGSFKLRGAYNALCLLTEAERRRGAVAFSSGNHAQGLALAAKLLDVPAVIVMPRDAPTIKLEATRGYGAEVVLYDHIAERVGIAERLAEERGLSFIPPYEHPGVIAGQGTAALELFDETGPLDILAVCCGGGGLLTSSAIVAAHVSPGCRVIGVEPEAGDDATRSFRTGTLHSVEDPQTIADGARTLQIGPNTFTLLQRYVADMTTVTDAELIEAMRFLFGTMKVVAEPTGALAPAALLAGKLGEVRGLRVGLLVSGGNVDLSDACRWLG